MNVIRYVDVDMGINRRMFYDDTVARYKRDGCEKLPPSKPAICHDTREHHARGMCMSCYKTWNGWVNGRGKNPPKALATRGIGQNGRDPNERLD
jgi:hypothetical protein